MVENFPNGNATGLPLRQHALPHPDPRLGDVRADALARRLHPLLLLLPVVFLLDFKRELVYSDVYATWEVIWATQHVASSHFVLFLALALLETYRDIILSNCMDFTDIIKFFNEMAERHDASAVLALARDLVLQLQLLIENK
ncbi:hypothetical protein MTP99_006157 [Tenebrio molitor]|nr:hypothetical protein MTP99_006157 [Tenebrio molitor]